MEATNDKCYYCGNLIDINQKKKLSGKKAIKNMTYIHALCSEGDAVFCRLDLENLNELDIFDIVQETIDVDSTKHRCKKTAWLCCFEPRCSYEKII